MYDCVWRRFIIFHSLATAGLYIDVVTISEQLVIFNKTTKNPTVAIQKRLGLAKHLSGDMI